MISHALAGQYARIHYRKEVAPHMPHHGKLVVLRVGGFGRPRNHSVILPDGSTTVVPAGNLLPVHDPHLDLPPMHNRLTTYLGNLMALPLDESPTVALSLRQPWAHFILSAVKKVENRKWISKRKGWVLIHAAARCPHGEYAAAVDFAKARLPRDQWETFIPKREDLPLGGIVGAMKIAPSDRSSTDPWRMEGQTPIPILEVRFLPFIPCKGILGFFVPTCDDEVIDELPMPHLAQSSKP